ncbi:hypothetical protein [Maribacter sp. 2304DJ31-5]|uniref:hypothetical protein n=1 Tax=Maribacter sp. 2304DJ31-5 TaxID=3386273 RepID=UPI0039BC819D
MKYLKKTYGIVILVLVVSCQIFDKSENRLIKEYYNPKSNMKVIVFEKIGNATVNNSIQASIHGYDYELKNEDIGNVFVADKIEEISQSVDSILMVNWIENETVEFIHPKNIWTFKTEKRFENNVGKVRIEYKSNE